MRIIAGTARGRKIEAPPGTHTRPTLDRVRENLFNMIQGYTGDSKVLDLFAGSGSLSLEAVSRGAERAVLCDSDLRAHLVERRNAESLGFGEKTQLFHCDWRKAVSALEREGRTFDLVFLDPPYAMTDLNEVFSALIPLITGDSLIVLEHEARASVSVPGRYEVFKSRSWGYCSVTLYRLLQEGSS